MDYAGMIVEVNTQTERLFGYARQALHGQSVTVLLPERLRARYAVSAIDHEPASPFFLAETAETLYGLRYDGSEFPMQMQCRPCALAQNSTLLGVMRALPEPRALHVQSMGEERLCPCTFSTTSKALAERLLLATQAGRMGIWDWERQSGIVRWDDLMYRLHGLRCGACTITYDTWLQRVHPADRWQVMADFQAIRAGCDHLDTEVRVLWPDGSTHVLKMFAQVQRDNDGRPQRLVGISYDITEARQREQEMQRLNTELEQRVQERTVQLAATNRELEAFCYSVSHDLRAPLRAIDGFSQALLEDYGEQLDDEAQRYLMRVRAGSQRMGLLIDDLLNLAHLTRHEMHRTRVHLSRLATSIAAEWRATQPQRQVIWDIMPDMYAEADANLLRVVLENLLGNAWKYTSKHTQAHISFGMTVHRDQPAYFVRDDGAGFNMAYADKLFGAFQRLHRPDEFAGTGIGLAIVERIIHRHGGQVWAEGAVEQGATFYFTLAASSLEYTGVEAGYA
jgi:PAS domain S-box-containing protein